MKIRYTNTLDDYMVFQKYHHHNKTVGSRKLRRWFVGGLCLLLWAKMSVRGFGEHGYASIINGAILAVLAGAGYFLIVNVYEFFWFKRLERSMRNTENNGFICEHELEIADTELVERNYMGVQTVKLEIIEKICDIDNYTFIYINSIAGHVLPEGRMVEGDYNDFVTRLRHDANLSSN